jgi:hypothetical protein
MLENNFYNNASDDEQLLLNDATTHVPLTLAQWHARNFTQITFAVLCYKSLRFFTVNKFLWQAMCCFLIFSYFLSRAASSKQRAREAWKRKVI